MEDQTPRSVYQIYSAKGVGIIRVELNVDWTMLNMRTVTNLIAYDIKK